MKIEVTAKDIELGIRSVDKGDTIHECAVARAIKRMFPDSEIAVGFKSFSIISPTGHRRGWLSDTVMYKILDIMNGKYVQPFDFELPETRPETYDR